MFIKKLICNYNAQKLLLVVSRLIFALDAWVAIIFIMELIVVLLFNRKRKCDKGYFNPLFWVFMITFPLAQPTIMI